MKFDLIVNYYFTHTSDSLSRSYRIILNQSKIQLKLLYTKIWLLISGEYTIYIDLMITDLITLIDHFADRNMLGRTLCRVQNDVYVFNTFAVGYTTWNDSFSI